MGIGFVLLIWIVIGTILAGVGSVVLGSTAAYCTQGAQHGRKRLILATSLFPFLCLGWGAVVFAFQAIVNETVLHRDAVLGDAWKCPLPNGYALLMIDTTDHGFVYNPKTQSEDDVVEQEDAIAGVCDLQIAGRYILGGADSHWGPSEPHVDSYFLLDTQVGKRTSFPTYEALRSTAQQLHIGLNLEPIDAIYSRYRFTRFEVLVGLLLCLPPLVVALLLFRWVLRLRRSRGIISRPGKA